MHLPRLLQPRRLRAYASKSPSYPDGHFYSPVTDPGELRKDTARLWPDEQPQTPGIEWSRTAHEQVLKDLAEFAGDYAYSGESRKSPSFYEPNGLFDGLDARMLYGFLRFFRPARFVEVGSGMSTLLTADVNTRFLDGKMDFTAIEPFPSGRLRKDVPGLSRLIESKVQDVPLEHFTRLSAGDILFIDSSHVAKTGSDVLFLYLQVLPRLESGVIVHIHDVFLPWEYPADWVLDQRRNWNEQYFLQAMLAGSSRLRIVFANHFAARALPEDISACWGNRFDGGSIWLRVA